MGHYPFGCATGPRGQRNCWWWLVRHRVQWNITCETPKSGPRKRVSRRPIWKKSVEVSSKTLVGRVTIDCCWWLANCFWHFTHRSMRVTISLLIPSQNSDYHNGRLVTTIPWYVACNFCKLCRQSGQGTTMQFQNKMSPFSTLRSCRIIRNSETKGVVERHG